MQKYVILMENSKFGSLQPETFVRIKIIEMGIVFDCIHHSKSHTTNQTPSSNFYFV